MSSEDPLTPRPYQADALKRLATNSSGLDASDMGVGKTLVGVERLRDIKTAGFPRVLIVAPPNTHRQWAATFARQYPGLEESGLLRIVGTPGKDPESWALMTARRPGVYIVGWEVMRGELVSNAERTRRKELRKIKEALAQCQEGSPEYAALVANRDELLAVPTQRRSAVKAERPTVQKIAQGIKDGDIPPWTRTGTWDLVIADEVHRLVDRFGLTFKVMKMINGEHKLALSGTPAGNKAEGIWAVGNWLWPQMFTNFWDWAEAWLEIRTEVIGSNRESVRVIVGEKAPGIIFSSLPCVVRNRLEDVATQLPEVIERTIRVEMRPEQRRIYAELEERAFAWLADQPLAAPLPIVQRIRLRQAALGELAVMPSELSEAEMWMDELPEIGFNEAVGNAKIDALKEIMADLPPREPLLVLTHSSRYARLVAKKLGTQARLWIGATSHKKRDELKATLGQDYRVLVAVIPALAEGVDGLQRRCRCEVWMSETDDMVINQQAAQRLHRPGQTTPVQRWRIHSIGTLDEDVRMRMLLNGGRMARMYQDI